MIKVKRKKGRAQIRFGSELTIYHAEVIHTELAPLLRECDELEFKLGEVAEIDTAGVQLLLVSKRAMADRGGELRLSDHSAAVVEAFDLYQLHGHFGDPVVLSH